MARSVAEINDYLVKALVTNMAAIGITLDPLLWSKRNLFRLICYTVAIGQALLEQLQDVFLANVEEVQSKSAAASTLWLQDAMFKFQYSLLDPQVLQIIDNVPQYPVVDETLRIITACSVKSNISNQVKIKVAKDDPFVALDALELAAAQSYIEYKGAAGITYIVSSGDADKLYLEATIWYQGQYAAVIQDNVINAVNAFLQTLSKQNFDGSLKLVDLEVLIRQLPGVNDVLLTNVRARKDADVFADGTDLVLNQTVISRLWNTDAGYIVEEDTVGKTFTDSLTFVAE
jgi:hypothetical protein